MELLGEVEGLVERNQKPLREYGLSKWYTNNISGTGNNCETNFQGMLGRLLIKSKETMRTQVVKRVYMQYLKNAKWH